MHLINNAITWWNSDIIVADAGRMGMPLLTCTCPLSFVQLPISQQAIAPRHHLQYLWWRGDRSIQNFSENLSLVPSEACNGYPGTDQKSEWARRMQTHQCPMFYHRNSIKLNEVRLSLMWRSNPCNSMVWALKKLYLCGCLKWRHISETYYRQLKIPDAVSFHHGRAGIAMVPKP